MIRTCPNCYSPVNAEHKFCTQCGKEVAFHKFDDKAKDNSKNNFEQNNNHYTDNKSNEKKQTNEPNWYIYYMVLSIILVIFIVIFSNNTKSDEISLLPTPNNQTLKIKTPVTDEEKEKLFKEAKSDFNIGNYDNSILKFEKLTDINYIPGESNFYLAESLFMNNKYDRAINFYKKSSIINDKATYMPLLLLHCAISYENIKDKENAKTSYSYLIKHYPKSHEAKIAKLYIDKNNLKKESKSDFDSKKIDSDRKYQINNEINSYTQLFLYKDWKYESFDKNYRVITNGKVGATGHEFGIIQPKEQCSNNYIWLTFSTISDVIPYIGEKVNFKISIDENVFYQELPIYDVTKVSKSLNIVTFSNFVFNDYSISLLKKGKKIKIEIIETNKLYDKFDIKYEEFSLEGFVANYMKLEERCSSSNNKTLFEYLENRDYGTNGIDRTYKLIKNGQSCIYNYNIGHYNGVVTNSCSGRYEFQVRDNNDNFVENNDNHWSPIPYHDAFRLMTGNEMKVNQKMISTFNSKNELIYCLDDMTICKTEKELKINSDYKKIDAEKKTFSSTEYTPQYSNSNITKNTKAFESALSEQECYNKGMYPSKRYPDGSIMCSAEHSSYIENVQLPKIIGFKSALSEQECYNKGMYPSKRYSDGSVLCSTDGSLP